MDTDYANPLAVELGYHVVKMDEPEVLDWFEPTVAKQIHIELWHYIADRDGNRIGRNHDSEINCWEHFPVAQWELQLELVRDKMQGLTRKGDGKIRKNAADTLLVHALEMVAEGLEDEDRQTLIAEIIEAYKSIDKWYA